MKYSFFCPHSFLIFILCTSFLISAESNTVTHLGGKAVKADLVAILSQLKKVAQSRSFQNDLAQLIKKHIAKIDLNKEQFKDLKEFLTIFDQMAKIDLQQLDIEWQQSAQEFSQKMTEILRLQEAKEAGDISEQEYIDLSPSLRDPRESVEKETWPLLAEWESLNQQLDDKFKASDLIDALKEVFGNKYDIDLMSVIFAAGSNAAQAAMKIIDGKLDYQKKRKKFKEAQ